MRKVILSFFTLSTLLISCGGGDTSVVENSNAKITTNDEGRLDFAIPHKYNSLEPINISNVEDFQIASQLFESLLRFSDKDLSIQPMIAESWNVSDDNLSYTLKLKKGIFFHDNECFDGGKGRELKATDVAYSFNRIISEKSSYAHNLFVNLIKGANEVKSGEDISGLKVIDDYTVEIKINKPSSNFLNLLATIHSAIVPQEAIAQNTIVGSGPFIYNKANDSENALTLTKNNNYHLSDKSGNKLPYLNSVRYNYIKSNQDQLEMFMSKKLDVVAKIPPESVKDVIESQIADFQKKPIKYVLGRYPMMTTSFLQLNTALAPFNDINVRQALAMAINKSKIVDDVLKGEAYGTGSHGIVPPAVKNYNFSSISGHEYNVAKAKELLKKAGYPNGKGFPTLNFGTKATNTALRVSLEIQKQLLTNLNINLEISSLTRKEMKEMNNKSELHLSFGGWLGEFPGPVNFLSLFYGKNVPAATDEPSFPNGARFKNSEFDELYEQTLITLDNEERYKLCLKADQIIATEVPVIPLWYHENYQLIQSEVTGYQPNSMKIHYLTYVKLKEPSPKAE